MHNTHMQVLSPSWTLKFLAVSIYLHVVRLSVRGWFNAGYLDSVAGVDACRDVARPIYVDTSSTAWSATGTMTDATRSDSADDQVARCDRGPVRHVLPAVHRLRCRRRISVHIAFTCSHMRLELVIYNTNDPQQAYINAACSRAR